MELVRDVDSKKAKQAIVTGIVSICSALDIRVLAEGIETVAERDFLRSLGISLMQGYLFSKPAFRALGRVDPSAWA